MRWEPTLLGEPTPPRLRILTPIQEGQASAQADAWLKQNVIEDIPTPALLNNLVMVAKKDGRIRVCIDCTPANQVTEDFDWPLPRLQDLRWKTRGNRWFTRIDLKDAFFRISVPKQYRRLTAFKVKGRSYQFTRMPFGLKTAPAVFQRYMDRGLSEFDSFSFWYIDDVLICAENREELITRERAVRARLEAMGSTIAEGKVESCKQGLLFAGIWIFSTGVGPNHSKMRELRSMTPPQTKKDAQSALGLVSYLRDFIPLVSHFTASLYPDKQGLKLDPKAYAHQWNKLMGHLQAATTMRHWTEGQDADLYTDADDQGLGAILMQNGRAVALASRKLTPAETRYSATDREHLGLLYAARKFKLFLHQSNAATRVWTDHAALTTRKTDDMTPRQARWHTYVSFWMPNVTHIRGKDNPADFVSRWKCGDILGALKT